MKTENTQKSSRGSLYKLDGIELRHPVISAPVGRMQFWLVIISALVNPLAFDMFYWSGESMVAWISEIYHLGPGIGYKYVNTINTAYIFGVFVSQIIWSVAFGEKYRRWPFIAGMSIIMLASFLGTWSENWLVQILARALMGAGVSCEITAATILIADWYSNKTDQLNYSYSIMTIVSFLGSMCAPLLSIFLIDFYGTWKIIYILMATFSVMLIVGIYSFVDNECNPNTTHNISEYTISRNSIYSLAINAKMLQQIVINGLCFGNMTIYYSSAVFIFIYTLQTSAQTFGILMTINVLGAILGSVINTSCRSRECLHNMLRWTIHASFAITMGMIVIYYLNWLSLWVIEILLCALSICSGIIIANSTSGFILASNEYISISIGLYNVFRFGFALLASTILIPVTAMFELQGILYLVLLLIILQMATINMSKKNPDPTTTGKAVNVSV